MALPPSVTECVTNIPRLPPSGSKKARRGPKVVFRRIGADGGRRRDGRTNTKMTMAPSLCTYIRGLEMENWPCSASGNIGVKKCWRRNFRQTSFLALRESRKSGYSRFCLCLRTASSAGRNSPGSNRASGPRFRRAAAASSEGNLAAAAINFAAPPSKERRLRGPEIGRKSGGGGGPSRKAAPYVEVKLWQYVLKCGHRLDKEERTRRTSRLFPQNVLMNSRITCSKWFWW